MVCVEEQQMEVTIIDMFTCGSEPTSSALSWALLCMVAFPDVQKKCHNEIDTVIISFSVVLVLRAYTTQLRLQLLDPNGE